MTQQTINNGEAGIDVRNAINENFTEVYAAAAAAQSTAGAAGTAADTAQSTANAAGTAATTAQSTATAAVGAASTAQATANAAVDRATNRARVFGLNRDVKRPIVIFGVGPSIMLGHSDYLHGPYPPLSQHWDYQETSPGVYGLVQAPDLASAHRADYVYGGPAIGVNSGGQGDLMYGLAATLIASLDCPVITVKWAVGGCSIKQLEAVLYQDGVLQTPIDNNIYDLMKLHMPNIKSLLAAFPDAPDYPDYLIWNIGPKEALKSDPVYLLPNADYMPPIEYAERSLRLFDEWSNPDAADWISPDTRVVILGSPADRNWSYDGSHQKVLANIMGPQALLVAQKEVAIEDFVHPTGDGYIEVGEQIARCIVGLDEPTAAHVPGRIIRNKTQLEYTSYLREADGITDVSGPARWRYDGTNGLLIIDPRPTSTTINWGWMGLREDGYLLFRETANPTTKKVYLRVTGRARYNPEVLGQVRIPVQVMAVGSGGWPGVGAPLTISTATQLAGFHELLGEKSQVYARDSDGHLEVDSPVVYTRQVTYQQSVTFEGVAAFADAVTMADTLNVGGDVTLGANLTLSSGEISTPMFLSHVNGAIFGVPGQYFTVSFSDGIVGQKIMATTGKFYGLPTGAGNHIPVNTTATRIGSSAAEPIDAGGRITDFINGDVTKAFVSQDGSFVVAMQTGESKGYIFSAPGVLSLPDAAVVWDEDNQRLSLANYRGANDHQVQVGVDYVAMLADNSSNPLGLIFSELSGNCVLVAGNRDAPTTAAKTLTLKTTGNDLQDGAGGTKLASLAGTLQRSAYVDNTGKLKADGFPHTRVKNTVTTSGGTNALLYQEAPADGARVAWELLVTGNRTDGGAPGTFEARYLITYSRVVSTIETSAGVLTSTLSTNLTPGGGKATTGTGSALVVRFGSWDFASNTNAAVLAVTGNSGEDWTWRVEGFSRSLL